MKKLNPIEKSQYINSQYKEYLRSSFKFDDKDIQKMGLSNVHQIEVLKKENTIDLWSRTWTDFKKMRKHFIENNNNIALIKVSTL